MQFTRLWPLGLLIAIPLLILLYMLRKQNKPKVVSSTFLWQEIYETTYADKPWQKLKNHILLILQIIAVLLIVLALMMPKVPWGEHYYKNVIFVVDNSASMNAIYGEGTRLDAAKDWMKDYIHRSGDETKGYLITTGGSVSLALAGSSKMQILLDAIDQLTPHYSVAKLDEGIQMAKALGESLQEAYEIVVLTDTKQESNFSMEIPSGKYVYFGNSGLNGAITLMAHQSTNDGMIILMQVTNKGNVPYVGDASLYGEDELLDVQEVNLQVGESVTLHFNLASNSEQALSYDYLKGELSAKDSLQEDNSYYYVQNETQGRKILLVTKSNVFLEKALMTLEDSEVYKTDDISMIDSDEQYDLYVLDGQDVTTWPKSGNVLLVNCDTSSLIEQTPLLAAHKVEASGKVLPNYLRNLNFVVNECTGYAVPYWGSSILKTGDQTVGFIGEKNGQKVAALGFNLWNSDFVLKTEFPLLMYYLGDELLDTARVSKSNFTSDEIITLRQNDINEKLTIHTLDGKTINLEGNSFTPDTTLGVYQVEVDTTHETFFLAVNYPASLESDLSQEVQGEVQTSDEAGSLKGNMDLTPYLVILLLGVVLTEWYFYRKGY